MKKLLLEIQKLSEKLMIQWYNEGVGLKDGQDAVLVIIKEYMNPQNPNVKDAEECIQGLKMLLKK
jgi:hypothetical protein